MSLLDSAKKFFKPLSPVGTKPLVTGGEAGDTSASRANADYRLDLALQNLLAIGMEYSPDDIIALRRRARYGDPRWLYSLYDEMTRLGPAPQVLKAREAIKGTDTIWKATPIEADEDENTTDPKDKAARLIRDVTEEAWAKWLPDLKSHLSTKYFYGIAAAQVMWKPNAIEGKWSRVTDIRPVPARRFRLDPQTMRFKFLTNPYSFEGPFVDDLQAQGKLIFVEVGADVEPLDQRGLLFQCLIPWAIEQFTVRWRAKRLQNFGMPPVMVKYPKGDPNNKAIADQLADLLANGTRASLPMDMTADLLSAPGSGSRGGDPYETNIEWCERAYDKIILGHSQVSGVQEGAGSRTSSNDAIGLFKDVTNSRAKELDEDLRQQCWYPYVAREFGGDWADDHCPVTESRVFERDNAVELADVVSKLAAAGLGGAIAAEDIVERCTLKVPEDGELTVAGNVKGEHPAPTEVEAINKANPAGLGEKAHVEVDADGKAVQKIKKQPLPAVAPNPAFGPPQKGQPPAVKGGMPGAPGAKPAGKPPAAGGAAASKKKFAGDFYTKRQRFGAAALNGGRPRVILKTFGHEFGVPDDTAMNFDVRSMSAGRSYDPARTGTDLDVRQAMEAHPMTGAIYGGVKSRVKRAISAATLTGETNLCLGIGCEHGKHRSVYTAERLHRELLDEGHDVTCEHRDAHTASGERGIGNVVDAAERFHAEEVPPVPVRFTGIETVEDAKKVKLNVQARIAARVRARLKEQHALAAAEAEQKLAQAE